MNPAHAARSGRPAAIPKIITPAGRAAAGSARQARAPSNPPVCSSVVQEHGEPAVQGTGAGTRPAAMRQNTDAASLEPAGPRAARPAVRHVPAALGERPGGRVTRLGHRISSPAGPTTDAVRARAAGRRPSIMSLPQCSQVVVQCVACAFHRVT
ncbi:hypothetical protein SSCG_00335 [Streptomyces clavuligerus]|nr:hypothetical protein SSCG_00335 [Streptomyces clavuligerus]